MATALSSGPRLTATAAALTNTRSKLLLRQRVTLVKVSVRATKMVVAVEPISALRTLRLALATEVSTSAVSVFCQRATEVAHASLGRDTTGL